jgi:hypothetical protein
MNIHPIVQFLKDVFVNSVYQCCAKVLHSSSFIFYVWFCKFTFCTLLVSSLSSRNTKYCLKFSKAILSFSWPLCPYAVALCVLWSPLFVCLVLVMCVRLWCDVMWLTRINFACSLNYMLNRYCAFCVSRLPWLNVKGLVKNVFGF